MSINSRAGGQSSIGITITRANGKVEECGVMSISDTDERVRRWFWCQRHALHRPVSYEQLTAARERFSGKGVR